jgi:5S rRNA maturation endonuclease (ribonuclease M5)
MDDEERFERLMEVLEDLAIENLETPILVEGRRDVEALRVLGCAGEVLPLNAGATLHDRAEAICASGARAIILLTDWDRKGEELYARMRSLLEANRVRVSGEHREKLRLWMRPPVNAVEDLAAYVARNLARYHRKDLADP